ncbi:dipeptidase [Glutamicibacter sp.]|uniref:dipeptidase n=1 Tax=Glutamicibacter sp. TaxID=1931995 RepID=UPI0028BD949D|nr:dipeptidase [Glutamicibacter sp.]
MSRATSRRTRGIFLGVGAFLALALIAFFVFAPGIVERSRNELADTELPPVGDDARTLHEQLAIVDMHSDTLMWDRSLLKRAQRGHVDLPRLQEGNVALQIFSSVSKSPVGQNYDSNSADSDNITLLSIAQLQPPKTWFSLLERSRFHAQKLKDDAENSEGTLRVITTKGQLEQLLADRAEGVNVTGAVFSVEGLQNLEGNLTNLDVLYADGMRMAGLTHFFDNEAAGSMHGEAKGGLTDLGRAAVQRMEQLGIVVDLAHSSEQTIDEVLSMATRPVVFSHGGVQATCKVNRNLNDDQIRRIAATGGVVGIGYWDAAICTLSVDSVVDAIEHVIKVGGIQSVGLGSDFDGSTEVAWDTSQLALITQELKDRGYSDSENAAIMGGNTLRVLSEVLPES